MPLRGKWESTTTTAMVMEMVMIMNRNGEAHPLMAIHVSPMPCMPLWQSMGVDDDELSNS